MNILRNSVIFIVNYYRYREDARFDNGYKSNAAAESASLSRFPRRQSSSRSPTVESDKRGTWQKDVREVVLLITIKNT